MQKLLDSRSGIQRTQTFPKTGKARANCNVVLIIFVAYTTDPWSSSVIQLLQVRSLLYSLGILALHMGQFGQFGLNGFKRGETHFSQLHISLDPDELESWNCVCSLITAMCGLAKVTCMGCDHWTCPKIDLEHLCIFYADLSNHHIISINL